MVTVNDIGTQPPAYEGEPPRGKTWAYVRAPLWNGSGFVANPIEPTFPPSSNNWSPSVSPNIGDPIPFHDFRYYEDLTSLRKAFPVSVSRNSIESPSASFSTPLGVVGVGSGESYDLYLSLGTGYTLGGSYPGSVLNYYVGYPGPPDLARTGYDYETTKNHLLGATANMTITTASSTFTANVVITSALFPSDMFDSSNLGVYITTTSEPVTSCYISSVVLP
jgi:hypothetical protein